MKFRVAVATSLVFALGACLSGPALSQDDNSEPASEASHRKPAPVWPGLRHMEPYPNAPQYKGVSQHSVGARHVSEVKFVTADNTTKVYKFYTESLPKNGFRFDVAKCTKSKIVAHSNDDTNLLIEYSPTAEPEGGTAVTINHDYSTVSSNNRKESEQMKTLMKTLSRQGRNNSYSPAN